MRAGLIGIAALLVLLVGGLLGVVGIFLFPIVGIIAAIALVVWMIERRAEDKPPIE